MTICGTYMCYMLHCWGSVSVSVHLQMLFILLLCIHVHYWNLETLSSLFQASLSCCYPNPILSSSHPSFLSQSPFVLCECKVGHLVTDQWSVTQKMHLSNHYRHASRMDFMNTFPSIRIVATDYFYFPFSPVPLWSLRGREGTIFFSEESNWT